MQRSPGWSCGMFAVVGMLAACSSTENVSPTGEATVESRGVGQMQRPMNAGIQPPAGGTGQSNAQLPTFPQKFEVQGPETDSFGFIVTQPGPIIVDVQGQGAPVLVTLQSPGAQPIAQQAAGSLRVSYNVTPQDVQRSLFWFVQIRLVQPMPLQQGGRAAGTVNVQYPPVNQAQAQSAIAVQQQAAQQQAVQQQGQEQQAAAHTSAQMEQAFQQRKAQFQQQQTARRSALMAQVQPQLAQLQSRMGGNVRPRGMEGDSPDMPAEPSDDVGTRALKPSGAPLQQAPAGVRPPMMSAMQETASSQQALGAAGSGPPPQQVMSNPVIASLSVAQGQPGDPVMITGSGFGTSGGEVHFILGTNNDVQYQGQVWWYDNQIFVNVPDVSGLLGYNGQVYVVRYPDKVRSGMAAFQFQPALEVRHFNYHPDVILKRPQIENCYGHPDNGWCRGLVNRYNSEIFTGFAENDDFLPRTRLKNGWVLDDVYLYPQPGTASGAYLVEKRIGTDSPYFNVRWWMNACITSPNMTCTSLKYRFDAIIRGPKGVADGIVMP